MKQTKYNELVIYLDLDKWGYYVHIIPTLLWYELT